MRRTTTPHDYSSHRTSRVSSPRRTWSASHIDTTTHDGSECYDRTSHMPTRTKFFPLDKTPRKTVPSGHSQMSPFLDLGYSEAGGRAAADPPIPPKLRPNPACSLRSPDAATVSRTQDGRQFATGCSLVLWGVSISPTSPSQPLFLVLFASYFNHTNFNRTTRPTTLPTTLPTPCCTTSALSSIPVERSSKAAKRRQIDSHTASTAPHETQ